MDKLEDLSSQMNDPAQLLQTYTTYISALEEHILTLDEKSELQYRKLRATDDVFLKRIDAQSRRLTEVQKSLSQVKENFEKSSDGAIRVGKESAFYNHFNCVLKMMSLGLKLEKADGQKQRLRTAIEMMALVKEFEGIDASRYDLISFASSVDLTEQELRSVLPPVWQQLPFAEMVKALQGLRTILYNINCEEAKQAPVIPPAPFNSIMEAYNSLLLFVLEECGEAGSNGGSIPSSKV